MRYHNDVTDIVTDAGPEDTKHDVSGIVHDPTIQVCIDNSIDGISFLIFVLQGNREMSVIYSAQFKRIMVEKNLNKNKQMQDPFRSMLENSLGDILPKLLAFYVSLPAEEQCSARLVLLGPGIESEHTKLVVHKIVNARSSTFDAVEFIKGLPGGIVEQLEINFINV